MYENVVVEVFHNTTTLTIAELFHADLACQFVPCEVDGIVAGWYQQPDGSFTPPPTPIQPAEPTV